MRQEGRFLGLVGAALTLPAGGAEETSPAAAAGEAAPAVVDAGVVEPSPALVIETDPTE